MRIISQDGIFDFPYEKCCIWLDKNSKCVKLSPIGEPDSNYVFGLYSTEAKAQKTMEMLRTAYTGRFVTTANVPDDFNEQLKELMKGGFGTVIVKDTNDSRVEFNNLNGYFQFPQDEDVEV